MNVISVDSSDDDRLSSYFNVRERDLVGRRGLFVAEGEVVLSVLIKSHLMQTESVFISEKRLHSLSPLLSLLPESVPVYVSSQEIMDAVVGFPIHRGILAIGRRKSAALVDGLLAALPQRAIVLGLIGVSNHDNMGGIFRNAAAFGVDAIVADETSCDPLYRKAIRVSVGGALRVPFAQGGSGEDVILSLKSAGFCTFALSPAGALPIHKVRRPQKVALVLGAEGPGLPERILAQCEGVSIPMAQGFDSLNVATASGIALHHMAVSVDQL